MKRICSNEVRETRFANDEDVILQFCSLNDTISSSTMSAKDEIVLNVNDIRISISCICCEFRSVHDPLHNKGQFMKFQLTCGYVGRPYALRGSFHRQSCSHHILWHSCLRESFHFRVTCSLGVRHNVIWS